MTTAAGGKANIWRTGGLVFLTAFLFYLFIQLENYGIYFLRHKTAILPTAAEIARIVISQFQNLVVSGLLTLFFVLSQRSKAGRLGFCGALVFFFGYLTFNNIFYTIFFDHYQFGMIEGQETDLGTLKDSIFGEVGIAFTVNAALAVGIAMYMVGLCAREQEAGPRWPAGVWSKGRAPLIYAGVYAAVCAGMLVRGNLYNLSAHPFVSLAASIFRAAPSHDIAQAATTIDVYPLKHGTPSNLSAVPAPWRDVAARYATAAKKPNIVFFILESVGSLQMLPDGKINPQTTPFLASLAPHATLFTHVYDTFPGTVRSHVPIATGGLTITWGSVYEEYKQVYGGPTIVGELNKTGYKSGLFSAQFMDTENLGVVYENLPFDEAFTPEDGSEDFRKSNKLNSWGVDERRVMDKAIAWVDKQSGPFFLEYMTSSTHHPYSIPKDFKPIVPPGSGDGGNDRKSRYTNALNFTDAVIKQLLDHLKAQGKLEDTLVFICGDHGEAFGEWHPTNMTHKNYIYDENIRNFLMVIDPKKSDGPTTVPVLASVGDIAPTIVNAVSAGKRAFLGQNLWGADYKERIAYFHKNATPEKWGLRDGKWKFIAQKVGAPEPELYDMEKDPHELDNVADEHADLVKDYSVLVKHWYVKINKDYGERLKNFKKTGNVALSIDDLSTPGPKRLAFGYIKKKNFKELKVMNPEEDMVAWTFGVAFPDDTTLNYEWTSPSGKKRAFTFKFEKDWTSAHVFHKATEPMDEGPWKLALKLGSKTLIEGGFKVEKNAPLHNRRDF